MGWGNDEPKWRVMLKRWTRDKARLQFKIQNLEDAVANLAIEKEQLRGQAIKSDAVLKDALRLAYGLLERTVDPRVEPSKRTQDQKDIARLYHLAHEADKLLAGRPDVNAGAVELDALREEVEAYKQINAALKRKVASYERHVKLAWQLLAEYGWEPFGKHAGEEHCTHELEFWGEEFSEDGMPEFERVKERLR